MMPTGGSNKEIYFGFNSRRADKMTKIIQITQTLENITTKRILLLTMMMSPSAIVARRLMK
jgi:hypothetical protein